MRFFACDLERLSPEIRDTSGVSSSASFPRYAQLGLRAKARQLASALTAIRPGWRVICRALHESQSRGAAHWHVVWSSQVASVTSSAHEIARCAAVPRVFTANRRCARQNAGDAKDVAPVVSCGDAQAGLPHKQHKHCPEGTRLCGIFRKRCPCAVYATDSAMAAGVGRPDRMRTGIGSRTICCNSVAGGVPPLV